MEDDELKKKQDEALQQQIDALVSGKHKAKPTNLREFIQDQMARTPEPPSDFQRVVSILERSVDEGPIGAHGRFWQGVSREQFVALTVFDLPLIALGHGRQSNLVKALKGDAPFGADQPDPPAGARFPRMPAGRLPVSDTDIGFIEDWIDRDCPE